VRPIGSDRRSAREVLALLLATIPAAASTLVVLLMALVLTFPWENPGPRGWAVAILVLALLALVLAAGVVGSVAAQSRQVAWTLYVLHVVVAVVILTIALRESSHSDGKVLAVWVAVELCALLAVVV
jgi:hypothetical protein